MPSRASSRRHLFIRPSRWRGHQEVSCSAVNQPVRLCGWLDLVFSPKSMDCNFRPWFIPLMNVMTDSVACVAVRLGYGRYLPVCMFFCLRFVGSASLHSVCGIIMGMTQHGLRGNNSHMYASIDLVFWVWGLHGEKHQGKARLHGFVHFIVAFACLMDLVCMHVYQ